MLFFLGTCAGFIDTTAKWLIDLKFGICVKNFWLNKLSCCWYTDKTSVHEHNRTCTDWKTWDQILQVHESVSTLIL